MEMSNSESESGLNGLSIQTKLGDSGIRPAMTPTGARPNYRKASWAISPSCSIDSPLLRFGVTPRSGKSSRVFFPSGTEDTLMPPKESNDTKTVGASSSSEVEQSIENVAHVVRQSSSVSNGNRPDKKGNLSTGSSSGDDGRVWSSHSNDSTSCEPRLPPLNNAAVERAGHTAQDVGGHAGTAPAAFEEPPPRNLALKGIVGNSSSGDTSASAEGGGNVNIQSSRPPLQPAPRGELKRIAGHSALESVSTCSGRRQASSAPGSAVARSAERPRSGNASAKSHSVPSRRASLEQQTAASSARSNRRVESIGKPAPGRKSSAAEKGVSVEKKSAPSRTSGSRSGGASGDGSGCGGAAKNDSGKLKRSGESGTRQPGEAAVAALKNGTLPPVPRTARIPSGESSSSIESSKNSVPGSEGGGGGGNRGNTEDVRSFFRGMHLEVDPKASLNGDAGTTAEVGASAAAGGGGGTGAVAAGRLLLSPIGEGVAPAATPDVAQQRLEEAMDLGESKASSFSSSVGSEPSCYGPPFGVEYELGLPKALGSTAKQVAKKVAAASGLPISFLGLSHKTTGCWKLVEDYTVLMGAGYWPFEVVSPILCGRPGLEQCSAMLQALEKLGGVVNQTTGHHVHIGVLEFPKQSQEEMNGAESKEEETAGAAASRTDESGGGPGRKTCAGVTSVHQGRFANGFTFESLQFLAALFVKYERAFDLLMPKSRQLDSNEFIHSNQRFIESEQGGGSLRAMLAIQRTQTLQQLVDVINPYESSYSNVAKHEPGTQGYVTTLTKQRYYKLNFTNLLVARKGNDKPLGTIEFRHHSGTVTAEKSVRWIALLLHFVEHARTRTTGFPRPLHAQRTPAEALLIMFRECVKHQGMLEFWWKRVEELDGGGREGGFGGGSEGGRHGKGPSRRGRKARRGNGQGESSRGGGGGGGGGRGDASLAKAKAGGGGRLVRALTQERMLGYEALSLQIDDSERRAAMRDGDNAPSSRDGKGDGTDRERSSQMPADEGAVDSRPTALFSPMLQTVRDGDDARFSADLGETGTDVAGGAAADAPSSTATGPRLPTASSQLAGSQQPLRRGGAPSQRRRRSEPAADVRLLEPLPSHPCRGSVGGTGPAVGLGDGAGRKLHSKGAGGGGGGGGGGGERVVALEEWMPSFERAQQKRKEEEEEAQQHEQQQQGGGTRRRPSAHVVNFGGGERGAQVLELIDTVNQRIAAGEELQRQAAEALARGLNVPVSPSGGDLGRQLLAKRMKQLEKNKEEAHSQSPPSRP